MTRGQTSSAPERAMAVAAGYADDLEHIADELRRLDLVIAARVDSLDRDRTAAQDPRADLTRALSVQRADVEAMLAEATNPTETTGRAHRGRTVPETIAGAPSIEAAVTGKITERVDAALADGIDLSLPRLARVFGLDDIETRALVICLAPELRRRYDRLYAYLQDDITRKRPSVDLLLELLYEGERERWLALPRFGEHGRLRSSGLLKTVPDPYSPSGSSALACFLRLDERILDFLLGERRLDPRLHPAVRLVPASDGVSSSQVPSASPAGPAADTGSVARLLRLLGPPPEDPQVLRRRPGEPGSAVRSEMCPAIWVHGADQLTLTQTALAACSAAGRPALVVDADQLPAAGVEQSAADTGEHPSSYPAGPLLREALLQDAVLVLRGLDGPSGAGGNLCRGLSAWKQAGDQFGSGDVGHVEDGRTGRAPANAWAPGVAMIALGGEQSPWPQPNATVAVPPLDGAGRERVWRERLAGHEHAQRWAAHLAERYVLGADAITAAHHDACDGSAGQPEPWGQALEDLAAACRDQSAVPTGGLVTRLQPRYKWEDLVLPAARLDLLRELCNQVRHRATVYERWGLGRRVRHGLGVSALFSGPSGTGKTMAAEVIAADLGLDLHRVDLSQVSSKYIGETEKNLAAVFAQADAGAAVLFFDEADALFGRRTEISDAHDRYANLEVSYLLQRMEEYRGVVVLATNLRQNLDEAFTRRIRFLVDFPFPDESHRRRIWRGHLRGTIPLAGDVDVDLLARTYPLTGGGIKNVVVNAAFLAAADGGVVGMRHLLHGTRREFDKVGKVWSEPPAQVASTNAVRTDVGGADEAAAIGAVGRTWRE